MKLEAGSSRDVRPLEDVLAYRHDDVPYRFTTLWDLSLDEAGDLFDDVKRFLWLSASSDDPFVIDAPLLMLDEMWHNFILFTHEYHDFCSRYLGGFLHHGPTREAEKAQWAREYEADPEAFAARHAAQMRTQRRLIGERLGIETLRRWYVDYPRRYDDEFLRTKQRPPQMRWRPPS